MKKQRVVRGIPVEEGSGNVYTDLRYRDSESMLVKAQLAAKIAEILQRRALTQARAAEILGLTQPKVSAILKGRFRGISEHRLLECLTRLGRDVHIVIKPDRKSTRLNSSHYLHDALPISNAAKGLRHPERTVSRDFGAPFVGMPNPVGPGCPHCDQANAQEPAERPVDAFRGIDRIAATAFILGRSEISRPAIRYFPLKLAPGQRLLARCGDLLADAAEFLAEFPHR